MLPEQVRKRAERANQLVAELNGQNPGEPTPAPGAPPVDPPNPSPAPGPEPAPSPAPTPAPTPAPQPSPQDDPNGETWKQKYQTLQGVLAAESGRWRAEKKVFEDRIAALEQAAATPQAPPPPPAAPASQYSQDEIERFGPELLDLVTRKATALANEIVTQKMAELNPKFERVENQVRAVGQSVYESKEAEFWGELKKSVPDFETVNVSQDFLIWLGQEDDFTGARRQEILDNAAKRLDHQRVAKVFNAFKTASGIPLPGATPPAPPAPPAAPPISPSPRTVGTGGSGPTPREPQAPTVKRSEIAAHYRRSSSDPTYRNTPEYTAMETRIFQAQAANRVTND